MPKTKHEIIGVKFGRLTPVEYLGRSHWRCVCDCGGETVTTYNKLITGHTKSCGCLRHEGGKEVRDLTGQRFGRLVAIKEAGRTKQGQAIWLCQCDCGATKSVVSAALTSGLVVSCGCYSRENTVRRNLKHGDAPRGRKTRLYEVWCSMIKRCENPNDKAYQYYGGRGIKVADEWHDFSNFKKWAYANGYYEAQSRTDCTIDRINVDGNYEPGNCRWADWITQMNNTRRNKAYRRANNG